MSLRVGQLSGTSFFSGKIMNVDFVCVWVFLGSYVEISVVSELENLQETKRMTKNTDTLIHLSCDLVFSWTKGY